MRLDINFREQAYRREKQTTMLVYVFALLVLFLTLYLFTDYLHLSSVLEEREGTLVQLKKEHSLLLAQRERLKPVDTEMNPGLVDYESFLGRYVGRAPDVLLYDLEKTVPEGVYITNLSYDRASGVAVVNAVANRPEYVTKILVSLEQVADYSQVMLTNQAEMEGEGKTKFVFKIVDNDKVEGDE